MVDYSELLFARPSFIGGMARALDLGSSMNIYNDSRSELEADTKAMAADWGATGADIRKAINEYRQR